MFDTTIFVKAFADIARNLLLALGFLFVLIVLSVFISKWYILGAFICWMTYDRYNDLKNENKDKCATCKCRKDTP